MPWLTRYWVGRRPGAGQVPRHRSAARARRPHARSRPRPRPSMRSAPGARRWRGADRRRWRSSRASVGESRSAAPSGKRKALRYTRGTQRRPGSTTGSDDGFASAFSVRSVSASISRPRSPARCQPTAANARLSANASPSAALPCDVRTAETARQGRGFAGRPRPGLRRSATGSAVPLRSDTRPSAS